MLVAFSGVQTASGHRSDVQAIGALARGVGALVFADGSQLVGALPVAPDLDGIDVLAGPLLAGLRARGVVCAARDGNLRLAVHFYNHEGDIARVTEALAAI